MKKTVSMLLVFVILLSLCACGKKPASDTTDPDQETSTGIEETSNSTTETPQATDMEETTVSTEDTTTTPSEENNTKPTEKPIVPTGSTEKPVEPTNPTEAAEPEHTHSYSAATCTQAMICSCGATSGSALGHSFSNATCTEAQRCSHCGTTEGSALGHKWIDATCTMPKTCSVCKVTEGNAVGHSWSAATCTAPKTCSVCKVTEGSKAEHIVEGTTCKMCGQVVAVDPNNFNPNVSYVCAGNVGPRVSEFSGETYNLFTLTYLEIGNWCYSNGGYVQSDPYADWPQVNGTYYGPTAEWNGQTSGLNGGWSYQIIGSQIIISADVDNWEYEPGMGNQAIITCQLLSDGTLEVVSISGFAIPKETGIKVGSIFYPTT